jgi:hypothetical protein
MRAAVPDWRSDADHHIAEGDLAVENFHAYGRRTGELHGARPDGMTLTLRGIHIFRIADDKIVERWVASTTSAFSSSSPMSEQTRGEFGHPGRTARGLPWGVEPTCAVLSEQVCPITPTTYSCGTPSSRPHVTGSSSCSILSRHVRRTAPWSGRTGPGPEGSSRGRPWQGAA